MWPGLPKGATEWPSETLVPYSTLVPTSYINRKRIFELSSDLANGESNMESF